MDDDPDDDELFPRTRGLGHAPTDDECKKGHLDWEIASDSGVIVKRCRICGEVRPFEGDVLEP